MYIDGVILLSLLVIILIVLMMVYVFNYAKKHVDIDALEAKKDERRKEVEQAFSDS